MASPEALLRSRLVLLEPKEHAGRTISGQLYCTRKALWKLGWFLRDFGYDLDFFGRDEVDENTLLGLRGVVRVSRTILNGHSFLNLEAFAPAGEWEEPSSASVTTEENQEATDDLWLHPDQSVSALPTQLPPPLSRWLAGEEDAGRKDRGCSSMRKMQTFVQGVTAHNR